MVFVEKRKDVLAQSGRGSLNRQDIKSWLKNALVFLAPVLLVVLASVMKEVPADWKYGAVTLYGLNVLVDLLRKFVAGVAK